MVDGSWTNILVTAVESTIKCITILLETLNASVPESFSEKQVASHYYQQYKEMLYFFYTKIILLTFENGKKGW